MNNRKKELTIEIAAVNRSMLALDGLDENGLDENGLLPIDFTDQSDKSEEYQELAKIAAEISSELYQ